MNFFDFTTRVAHVGATIAAAVVAVGASVGYFHMTGNLWIAILAGVGIASGLAIGWYVLITMAAKTRRAGMRASVGVAGAFLVAIALGTSGWALATAIGGKSALSAYQVRSLTQYEAAFNDAVARADAQHGLVDTVRQHVVATKMKGDEEGRSGQGPLYRSYLRTSESLSNAASTMANELASIDGLKERGRAALNRANMSLGDPEAFRLALVDVSSVMGALNAIDVTGDVLSVGMVGLNDKGLPELSNLTTDLRANAEQFVTEPVAIPAYAPIDRADATMSEFPIGAWIAAAAIDVMPFLLLLMVMVASTEPLMRAERKVKDRVSDEEVRVREQEIEGLRVVAE